MRKLPLQILALLMITTMLLTACGGDKNGNGTPTPAPIIIMPDFKNTEEAYAIDTLDASFDGTPTETLNVPPQPKPVSQATDTPRPPGQ